MKSKDFYVSGDIWMDVTPTATETVLPWKREEDLNAVKPLQQNEFPAWCSNKDYLTHNSPSSTFLGNLKKFISTEVFKTIIFTSLIKIVSSNLNYSDYFY